MKTLNQTWKQKRPSQSSKKALTKIRPSSKPCSSNNNEKTTSVNSDVLLTHQILQDDSLNSFGFSCDWDNAEISAINELDPKGEKRQIQKSILAAGRNILIPPSPAISRNDRRGRISTPIDRAANHEPRFCASLISPVLIPNQNKKKIPLVEEKGNSSKQIPNKEENNGLHNARGHRSTHQPEVNSRPKLSKKSSLSLESLDLPSTVLEKYKEAGIKEMFPWQNECLTTGNALKGGNLVYSAPTSAGKTLVAELLMLKRVLLTKKKAIYILPFVSVAREKMFHLQNMFKEAGIAVDGYMGAQAPSGGFLATDIAVCTIEKANSLVNRLMEEKKISSLGVVVVDEMHMIGDGHRGYLLELMLSKIRFLQGDSLARVTDVAPIGLLSSFSIKGLENQANAEEGSNGIQIIGMSATLPNLPMFSSWLDADLYLTDYRPVPLTELMKVGKTVMDSNSHKVAEINTAEVVKGDEDHVIPLCLETLREGNSVLIFCPTKSWCEKLAKTIADYFKKLLESSKDTDQTSIGEPSECSAGFVNETALLEVIEQLRRSPAGLDNALGPVVRYGVSFHHAGLTFDERDVIESAFRRGAVRVLIATSTLSSGVNLPARRVILRTPIFHGRVIDSLVYKQMCGRAGRKGVDTMGESILICKPSEKQKGLKLLKSHLEPVYSCLLATKGEDNIPGMKRALLEIIAGGVASTPDHVEQYAKCTFLNTCLASEANANPVTAIRNTIKFLSENEFIRLQKDKTTEDGKESNQSGVERYYATQLGAATLASALSPDEALVVFRELQKARKCFVLENELHIVYQVMPIYMQSQWPDLDWYHYFTLFDKLPPQYKRVGEIVGVEEAFLARALKGRIPTRTAEQRQKLAVHQRFYSALVLLELINEISLRTVSRRYNVNKGLLQSLQSSASTFAGMVTKFCQKLGWRNLEMLLDQFQSRLSFGVSRELCDLVRITSLNGARARLFFNAGYHTVSAVAAASIADVTKLLENSAPFESRRNIQGEDVSEVASRNRARCIWVTGKDGLTEEEAAVLIVDEAKDILKSDAASMGLDLKNVQIISKEKTHDKERGCQRKTNQDSDGPLSGENFIKEKKSKETSEKTQSATKRMMRSLKRRSVEKDEIVSEKRSRKISEDNKQSLSSKSEQSRSCLDDERNIDVEKNFNVVKKAIRTSLDKNCNTPIEEKLWRKKVSDEETICYLPRNVDICQESKNDESVANKLVPPRKHQALVGLKNNVDDTGRNEKGKQDVESKVTDCNKRIRSTEERMILNGESTDLALVRDVATLCDAKGRSTSKLVRNRTIYEREFHFDINQTYSKTGNDKCFVQSGVNLLQKQTYTQEDNFDSSENGTKKNHATLHESRILVQDSAVIEDNDSINKEALVWKNLNKEFVIENKISSDKEILDSKKVTKEFTTEVRKPSHREASVSKNVTKELTFQDTGALDSLSEGFNLDSFGTMILSSDGKCCMMENTTNHSAQQPSFKTDGVFDKNNDTNDAKIEGDANGRCNTSHDANVRCNTSNDEQEGSVILFGSDTSASNDVTPELFPESFSEDQESGNSPSLLQRSNRGISRIEKNLSESRCLSNSVEFLPREENNKPAKTDDKAVNDVSPRHNSHQLKNDMNLDESIELNFSSYVYETQDQKENSNSNHFSLKLSESQQEPLLCSFQLMEDPSSEPQSKDPPRHQSEDISQSENPSQSEPLYQNEPLYSESLFGDSRSFEDERIHSKSSADENRNASNESDDLFSFTNVREKGSGIKSNDSDMLFDKSDSFEFAVQNFQTQQDNTVNLDPYPPAERCRNSKGSVSRKSHRTEKPGSSKGVEQLTSPTNAKEALSGRGGIKASPVLESAEKRIRGKTSGQSAMASDIDKALPNYKRVEQMTSYVNSEHGIPVMITLDRQALPSERHAEKRRNSRRIEQRASSGMTASAEGFAILDVVVDKKLFQTFVNEWRTKTEYSFSVAFDSHAKGTRRDSEAVNPSGNVVGVAICWGDKDSYYISLDGRNSINNSSSLNIELDEVEFDEIMKVIELELSKDSESVDKIVFDLKQHFQVLQKSCGVSLLGRFSDPKVAAWLLDPSAKELSIHELAPRYLSEDYKEIVKKIGGSSYDTGSIGLTTYSTKCPRLRASVEAVITYKLMSVFKARLHADGLFTAFRNTEMQVILTLGKMELHGIGFSADKCQQLESSLKQRMKQIEEKCRSLIGHSISMTSPEEIAHALFIELKLPPTGDPEAAPAQKRGSKSRRSKVRHLSTAKDVLEKLKDLHPLPKLILEWRKIHNALVKNVYPMQRSMQYSVHDAMYRIFSCCFFHTITGRIIVAEPSVQNVPKDFEMLLPPESCSGYTEDKTPSTVSLRKAFVPYKDGVLIAADYSQLELRIISHLSRDNRLLSILNNEGDVFRTIAAEINECAVEDVTNDQRQRAKQLCYGIIYGIGTKSLAEKLCVCEEDASMFMEGFKNRFRGIREFIRDTVDFARQKGYVLTMNNRRRYFPTINSRNVHTRTQAERQAVNTLVQGSAADLVKKAMVDIDEAIAKTFTETSTCLEHGMDARTKKPRLVLQMHDELIYECSKTDRNRVLEIVKTSMEQAMKLEVVLPVKIKTGTCWGELENCW